MAAITLARKLLINFEEYLGSEVFGVFRISDTVIKIVVDRR
jgi:hypothetical protein